MSTSRIDAGIRDVWAAAVVAAALAGCSSGVPPEADPSAAGPRALHTVRVSPATAVVAVGGTQQYAATAVYSDGAQEALATGVSWTSSHPTVATVDPSGRVSAKAPGSAAIRASFEGITGSAGVTVPKPPEPPAPVTLESVSVAPASGTLEVGRTLAFAATAVYSDASQAALTADVTWESSDASVATVDAAGVATGVAEGSAEIRATYQGETGAAPLAVAFRYDALVRRTPLGIPHVKAADFGSLGYGLGYAQAEDNLCVLMDDIITDRAERARYFGPTGTYRIRANSTPAVDNVTSDFFWKFLVTQQAIDRLRAASLPEALAATTGFKDGFNRYVREIKAGGHPGRHAACRGGDWVKELEDDDMYRRYLRLGLIASSSVFISDIVAAQPPAGGGSSSAAPFTAGQMAEMLRRDPGALAFFTEDRQLGSNMYALGRDATSSGMPMVFGNPHFPWSGPERLYIFHATIPGQMDIMGSALYGVPAVLIGFTDHFAWSHTVSTAFRFTFYELTLAPGNPTSYVHEGQVLPMQAVPLTIEVLETDGSITQRSRTLYRSKYGPMMFLHTSGANLFPWSTSKAYTLRDANAENDRLINQFFRWNTARSLDEFISFHASVLGIPWVNTVASGPNGKAYYGDVSVVPHVVNAKAQQCGSSPQAQAVAQSVPGLPVLDGSRASCEWGSDPDAPAPGIFGPANLPKMQRDDWVHNCNDSYWLTNPAAPITGYNRIIGGEGTERTLRTRLCIRHVQRHLDAVAGNDYDANGDRRFDLAELQETVLSSEIYSAELARDDVKDTLCANGTVLTESGPVNVTAACAVLGAWDLKDNLASVGGHIWREFFGSIASLNGRWLTPFSAADPVNTPRDLNVGQPQVQQAFGNAVKRIGDRGHALDAPMGELQYSGVIGENFVPVFGGTHAEGAFTIVSPSAGLRQKTASLPRGGYTIDYGNSYIQTVTWEPDGAGFTPVAHGFVTYSQSTDPASPHYFDFTQEYSAKRWHRFPFEEDEVAAATVRTLLLQE